MGVPGFTSFVNSIENLWERIDLHDTKLVIDGCALCYYLYVNSGLNCQCGGEYHEFYRAVVSFFVALKSSRVECCVVFDGVDDPSGKKLETIKKRAKNNIETAGELSRSANGSRSLFLLPLLSALVFRQALRDTNITFAICDSEADTEVASLAAAWNCPVLSNDSDFFIFDIEAGYIPLSSLHWNSRPLTAKIFYRSKLASRFRIRAELIPLLASLAGNDYVSEDLLADFNGALNRVQTPNHVGKKERRFAKIASILSKLPSLCSQEEALTCTLETLTSSQGRDRLQQAVEFSLQEYNFKDSNLLRYFEEDLICSSLRTLDGQQEIEEGVLRQFRAGKFSIKYLSSLTGGRNMLRVQVENCAEISANRCSLQLRRLVYGILRDASEKDGKRKIAVVQELDRVGFKVNQSNVEPYIGCSVPCWSLVPYLDSDERCKLLLFTLDSDTADARSLPESLILIASSARYLINHAQPAVEINHLKALLCCWLLLKDNVCKQSAGTAQTFDVKAAHSFCQWQCILRDAIGLNFILLEPVPTPCLHEVFSGSLAHFLQRQLNQGRRVEDLLPSFKQFRLFHRLYSAVTSDLLNKMIATQMNRGSKKAKKTTNLSNSKRNMMTHSGSRFAVLRDAEEGK